MAAIVPASGPSWKVTTADDTNTLEFGCPAPDGQAGTVMLRFVPDGSFSGSFTIKGRPWLDTTNAPVAIAYRSIDAAGTAGDYAMGHAAITAAAFIQVPANGMSVSATVTCSAGTCPIEITRVVGAQAV